MKKTIVLLLISAAAIGALPARAADTAVLAAYRDGVLVYSANAGAKDGEYSFFIPSEYENDEIKVYCAEKAECVISFIGRKEPEAPAETEAPTSPPSAAPTETPAETASPAPEKTPYPAVYEKALDAVNAPAVVLDVYEKVEDGETYYVTEMLYQGVKMTASIEESALIESAPAARRELIGQSAAALREGDVIHFTCNMQGRVRSIEFLYRPDFTDYVKNGESFSGLTGTDKYSTFVFGVPVKVAKGYMLIADARGGTTDVDLNAGTFVYTVRNSRGDKAELSGTGSGPIEYVRVPGSGFDDDGNVISWEDIDTSVYALARLRNGTATEVIVFVN